MHGRTPKNSVEDNIIKDPVCGMIVSRLTAPATCLHNGKTYYFCSDACRDRFETEPQRYTGKWPRKEL